MSFQDFDNNTKFISILSSDGTLREKAEPNTPCAILRKYELKDGTHGEKYELVHRAIQGNICDIRFYEGDYGTNLIVSFTDDGVQTVALSMSTNQNFGEDVMKKLPNIDLSKSVLFAPYAFTDERGKMRKGVSITQNGKKIENAFYDFAAKKTLLGFPESPKPKKEGGLISKEEWKMFFMTCRLFMMEYTENNIIPKVQQIERIDHKSAAYANGAELSSKIKSGEVKDAFSDELDVTQY